MPPSPLPTAIWWDLKIRKTFEPVTATATLRPKPLRGEYQSLLWRVGISGGILLLLAFLPFSLQPRASLCGFLWLTGRPCPFCGMTRALACLLKGDLALAISFHPLSPLALIALLVMFLGGPLRAAWEQAGWQTVPMEGTRFFWAGSWLIFLVYGAWRLTFGKYA